MLLEAFNTFLISSVQPCFNPSYTGYATGRTNNFHRRRPNRCGFQSFLYWICYWKRWTRRIGALMEVCVSILLILDILLEVRKKLIRSVCWIEFQSFLYWICYWKR